jgi:hypothetical protein
MEDADSEKPFATDSHRYNVTLMMWKTHRPTECGASNPCFRLAELILEFHFFFFHLQVQGVRNRNPAVVVVAK